MTDIQQETAQESVYTGYSVKTPLFEGPLDLLLYLVRNYEINVYDIPVTLITEQFLGYIKLLERLDLEVASEFIVMAAHLIVIKSRMLLPGDPEHEDDENDPRTELVAQLLEYQKFKEAAHILEESESLSRSVLERKAGQIVFEFPDDESNWVDVKLFDLVNAFSRIMAKSDKEPPSYPVFDDVEDDYDPEEKIAQLRTMLEIHARIEFTEIITGNMRRGEIIIIFLALLHMIKRGLIVVRQHRLFGDITIFSRQAPEIPPESDIEDGDADGYPVERAETERMDIVEPPERDAGETPRDDATTGIERQENKGEQG